MVSRGSLIGVGGTSAAAPAFAGLVALLNQALVANQTVAQPGLGNINPTLYRMAQASKDAFHDITGGDNFVPCVQGSPDCVNGSLGYAGAAGYDMATGLGSVDAAKLIAAWGNGDAATVTVSADSTTLGPSDVVKLTASVSGKGGTTPSGSITFVTSLDAELGSAQLAVSGDAASGSISISAQAVLAGDGKVYALYSGDAVYGSSVASVTLAAKLPASGSQVFIALTPNPTDVLGATGQAPVTVVLSEKAGVATRLTSATFNGNSLSVSNFFGGGTIPANGTLTSTALGLTSSQTPPFTNAFHFAGQDADGTVWTRDVTLSVRSSPGPQLIPGIALSSSLGAVTQNLSGDAACQWSHQLTVRETGGYYVTLATLRQGVTDLGNIQQLFGTTRLAPWGSLSANICLSSSSGPASRTYQITGVSELGTAVTATLAVNYTVATPAPAAMSVSTNSATLSVADPGQSDGTSFDVKLCRRRAAVDGHGAAGEAGLVDHYQKRGAGSGQRGASRVFHGAFQGRVYRYALD